jgi:hypothetical protein
MRGHVLAISGSPELMETLSREVIAERRSKPPRVLTGEDSLTGRGVRFSCVEGGTPLLEPANRFAE